MFFKIKMQAVKLHYYNAYTSITYIMKMLNPNLSNIALNNNARVL